jgi:hypothetical protein
MAKCGESLREIEEWSMPGGRDIDGQTRAGHGRADGKAAYWLELLVESGLVSTEELQPLRGECDQLTAIFVTILKRSKQS